MAKKPSLKQESASVFGGDRGIRVGNTENPYYQSVVDAQKVEEKKPISEQQQETDRQAIIDRYKFDKDKSLTEYINSFPKPKETDEKAISRARTFGAIGDMAMALSDAITIGKGGNIPKVRELSTPKNLKALEAERVRNANAMNKYSEQLSKARLAVDKQAEAVQKGRESALKDYDRRVGDYNKRVDRYNETRQKNINTATSNYARYEADKKKEEQRQENRLAYKRTSSGARSTGKKGRGKTGKDTLDTFFVNSETAVKIPKGQKANFNTIYKNLRGTDTRSKAEQAAKKVGGYII